MIWLGIAIIAVSYTAGYVVGVRTAAEILEQRWYDATARKADHDNR